MAKPLVVGLSPVTGRVGDTHGVAFVDTSSGEHLARLCGLESSFRLPEHFELVNLWRDPDPPSYSAREGRRRANALMREVIADRFDRVLCLGKPVAEAFLLDHQPPLEWRSILFCGYEVEWRFRAAYVPHPSGLTRWYNDPENRRRAQTFLRAEIRGIPERHQV